jgi:hypothetical protein
VKSSRSPNPRRFADARWPMEFSYPMGWFLEVTGTKLVVRSPDPQDMLFGNALECERGRGLPRVPAVEGAIEHFQGSYYRAHVGLQVVAGPVPDMNSQGRNCETPKTRPAGSTLLMSAETGYRAYARGAMLEWLTPGNTSLSTAPNEYIASIGCLIPRITFNQEPCRGQATDDSG